MTVFQGSKNGLINNASVTNGGIGNLFKLPGSQKGLLSKVAFEQLNDAFKDCQKSAQGAELATEEFLKSCNDTGFANYARQIKAGSLRYEDYEQSIIAANAQQRALNIEMMRTTAIAVARNAAITMGISVLIAGTVKLISYVANYNKNLVAASEEAQSAFKEAQQNVDDLNTKLEETQNRIKELQGKGALTLTEQSELARLQLQNEELRAQKQLLEDIAAKKRAEAEKKANKVANAVIKSDFKTVVDTDEGNSESAAYTTRFGEMDNAASAYGAAQNASDREKALSAYRAQLEVLQPLLDGLDQESELYKKINQYLVGYLNLSNEDKTNRLNTILQSDDLSGLDSQLRELAKSGQLTAEVLNGDTYSNFRSALSDAGIGVDEVVEHFNSMNSAATESSEGVAKSADEIATAWTNINNAIDKVQSSYQALSSAVSEYNENGGKLSLDTLQSLLSLDSEYLAVLDLKNGKLSVNEQLLQAQAEAQLNAAKAQAIEQANTELLAIAQESAAGATISAGYATAAQMQQLTAIVPALDGAASSVVNFALAQQFLSGYQDAAAVNATKTQQVVDGLNAKLTLIDSTMATVKSGTVGLSNAMGGFKSQTESATNALNKQKEALEAQKSAMDGALKAIIALLDMEIDKLQDANGKIDDMMDKLKDNLETTADVIDYVIDKQVKALEKQKDALSDLNDPDSYGARIQGIQDEIDAINAKAEAESKALAIQKAQDAYDRARTQRTMRLYTHDQGWIWSANQSDIDSAKEELDGALKDKELADLENKKTALEDALQTQQDALQAEIDALNAYKESFAEFVKEYEMQTSMEIAAGLLGKEWLTNILNDKSGTFDAYKEKYLAIQAQLNDLTAEKAANEERVTELNTLKDKWNEISTAYETEVNRQHAAALLGADWESQVLSGRISTITKFKDDYMSLAKQIEDISARISAASSSAGGSGIAGGGGGSSSKYKVIDKLTGKVLASGFTTQAAAQAYANANPHAGVPGAVQAYANGTLSAIGGVANVDDGNGRELILRRPAQGRLTQLEYGDGVMPADISKTILSFAQSPKEFLLKTLMGFTGGASRSTQGGGSSITIQSVSFPNACDANEIKQAFAELPNYVKQKLNKR